MRHTEFWARLDEALGEAYARSWADLPAEAVKYVRRVEELIGCPVAVLSTSQVDRLARAAVDYRSNSALTFGDRPVEYRVSTINTAQHDYVQLLSRPA